MLQRTDISQDVLDFIVRRIDSVPHLEALLLLWENPASAWSEDEVAARVYVGRDRARIILADLARNGLIQARPGHPVLHSYNPAWDERQFMQKVALTYRRHLVHIASFIHAKASSDAVREFARAFELKKQD